MGLIAPCLDGSGGGNAGDVRSSGIPDELVEGGKSGPCEEGLGVAEADVERGDFSKDSGIVVGKGPGLLDELAGSKDERWGEVGVFGMLKNKEGPLRQGGLGVEEKEEVVHGFPCGAIDGLHPLAGEVEGREVGVPHEFGGEVGFELGPWGGEAGAVPGVVVDAFGLEGVVETEVLREAKGVGEWGEDVGEVGSVGPAHEAGSGGLPTEEVGEGLVVVSGAGELQGVGFVGEDGAELDDDVGARADVFWVGLGEMIGEGGEGLVGAGLSDPVDEPEVEAALVELVFDGCGIPVVEGGGASVALGDGLAMRALAPASGVVLGDGLGVGMDAGRMFPVIESVEHKGKSPGVGEAALGVALGFPVALPERSEERVFLVLGFGDEVFKGVDEGRESGGAAQLGVRGKGGSVQAEVRVPAGGGLEFGDVAVAQVEGGCAAP